MKKGITRIEKIRVPSGAVYTLNDIQLLDLMAEYGFVRYGDRPFTLKSGIQSHVYVFGREDLTDNPVLEISVGEKMCQLLHRSVITKRQVCLIGIPTAGTPFAQAAAMMSALEPGNLVNGETVCHRIMKEKPKDHGAHKGWVNGAPNPEHDYWLVDNVATNGDSKIEAQEKIVNDGYPSAADTGIFIWIDRQQGAVDRLTQAGYRRIIVAYQLLDLAFAYGEIGCWPRDTVKKVEGEIRLHQFHK